ncbi:MAG: MBOAT family protein [Treponema sp.]|jgi:D-alanyl-lipoteichoic acid acyltransferase DltB (MBOAT superfamily)|nr:MBOAT family protein [Treponema sp.]
MVFSSSVFLFLFLPLVLIGYFNPIFRGRRFKNYFLLLVSLGFYTWGEPLFVAVMLVSIGVNWLLGMRIARYEKRGRRKCLLVVAVVYDVALLVVFKYLSFISRTLGLLLHDDRLSLAIALPIGISFFTFQIMSYVFDVYYKRAEAQKNCLDVALYIALFPQLIAGPIVRYQTVAEELTGRVETPEDFTRGMSRFIMGLGKKLLLANYAGFVADKLFEQTGNLSAASAWLGAAAYALQIFFDFSAYSDMAIGLGRIFGFHFLENFNYPYMATSITDFWRRWHISLSSWFRDYVYIPMGGSRVSRGRSFFNLLILWLLTGLWHGANWTFIAWGLFYFLLIAFERVTGISLLKKPGAFSRIYTLFFVIIGWALFRSESITLAVQYVGAMFGVGSRGLIDETFWYYFANGKWLLLAGILLSTPFVPFCKQKIGVTNRVYQSISAFGLAALFCLSLVVCIKATYNPFIYFNF